MQIVAIVWLDAAPLLDSSGRIALDVIRRRVEERLLRAPRLRDVVVPGGFFGGATWSEAGPVDLTRHVVEMSLPAPGTEEDLLELAAEVFMEPLDRARPLWELRLVTGLADGRVVALMKIHHAIADGPAAVRLLSSLFDVPVEALPPAASPAPAPRREGGRLGAIAVAARSVVGALGALAPAPRTSLNRPVGVGRRLAVVRLPLEEVRQVAHAHGGKVNDVVLALAAQGARAILERRGEAVPGGQLRASMFVALRREREELGNATGVLSVPLPVDDGDHAHALAHIAQVTAAAKRRQPAAGIGAVVALITRAGLGRALYRRQRQVNIFATNVVAPATSVRVFGARADDIAVVTPLAGNVTLTFAALSYAGRLNVTVIGDAAGCPEVDVAASAMRAAWDALRAARASTAART